jgi:phosphoglycolate phosphatase-like HAD superfamily hydrolase
MGGMGDGRGPTRTPLDLIILDNNGTMWDDLHVNYGMIREIYRQYATRIEPGTAVPTVEQFREEICADFIKFYRDHGFSGRRFPQSDKELGKELNVIRKAHYAACGDDARFRADLIPFLQECQNAHIMTAVCSAEMEALLEENMKNAGLRQYFSDIRGNAFPHKEATLARILVNLGIQPERTAYVDDTVDGLMAAKRMGMVRIAFAHETGYNSRHRLEELNPQYVVESFSELTDCLEYF